MLTPPEWTIENVLPAESIAVLFGPPGLGKSFQAIGWAFRIAAGRPAWSGRPIKHGDVIYVAAEGFSGLPPRVQAWKRRHGFIGKVS